MEQSQRLAEARAREEGALAAIETRAAAERPVLAVSAGYTRTNHVDEFGVPQPNGVLRVIYPDIPDNYFTRAALQWPIYTGGRTDALIRAAQAESRATTRVRQPCEQPQRRHRPPLAHCRHRPSRSW